MLLASNALPPEVLQADHPAAGVEIPAHAPPPRQGALQVLIPRRPGAQAAQRGSALERRAGRSTLFERGSRAVHRSRRLPTRCEKLTIRPADERLHTSANLSSSPISSRAIPAFTSKEACRVSA